MASQLFFLQTAIEGSMQRQRIFRDRLNPLDTYSDTDFIVRYRISRVMFIDLLDRLETFTVRPTSRSHSISMTTQLAVTLQFLATGTFQTVVGSCHGISQCAVSRCIATVTDALCACAKDFIYFPSVEGQTINQLRFQDKYGFPRVLGCVDGSHIPIVAPSTNEPLYVNRKGYHSINVQAICDADFRFIDIVIKWPGSTYDAFIWRQSGINQMINNGEIATINGWFLGDSGYPLRPNLMTPILSPVTMSDRRYNRAFLKTRKTIECTFGIWKSRWRSMDKTGGSLCYKPDRICRLILSTAVLHNFCIDRGLLIEFENLEQEMPVELVETDSNDNGVLVRQEIIANFFN